MVWNGCELWTRAGTNVSRAHAGWNLLRSCFLPSTNVCFRDKYYNLQLGVGGGWNMLAGTARRKGVCSSVKPCVMILQVSKWTLISLGVILAALVTFILGRHLSNLSLFYFFLRKKKFHPEALAARISTRMSFVSQPNWSFLFFLFYHTKWHLCFQYEHKNWLLMHH